MGGVRRKSEEGALSTAIGWPENRLCHATRNLQWRVVILHWITKHLDAACQWTCSPQVAVLENNSRLRMSIMNKARMNYDDIWNKPCNSSFKKRQAEEDASTPRNESNERTTSSRPDLNQASGLTTACR
jgi:hypothetical protein